MLVSVRLPLTSVQFLIFPKRRNIIRAGKRTHAEAVMSVVRFLSWSGLGARWPTQLNVPNAVFGGRFHGPVSKKIREYPFATYSDRFPGVAINVGAAIVPLRLKQGQTSIPAATVTPEVSTDPRTACFLSLSLIPLFARCIPVASSSYRVSNLRMH